VVADLGGALYWTRNGVRTVNPARPTGAHVPLEQEGDDRLIGYTNDMWAYGQCLHLIATKSWRDLDDDLTADFYRTLAQQQTLEADLYQELLFLYGTFEENNPYLKTIAKVIGHTLIIAPANRWAADKILQELDNAITGGYLRRRSHGGARSRE